MVEFQLHGIEELLTWVEKQGKAGEKAVSYTIKDIKSRAPGWIATETSKVYNIKKSEITPARTEESRSKKAVSVQVSGTTLETVSIVYRGRSLTPIHFSMTPKKPSRQRVSGKRAIPGKMIKFAGTGSGVGMVSVFKEYKIGYEVIKGRRLEASGKREWSRPFLAPVKAGSDKYIVFQRKGKNRTAMYSTRTVSVPQMIGAKRVYEKIDQRIMEATAQRLQHHLDRFAPK